LDKLDREFHLLAASARRTAQVQQDEVKRFLANHDSQKGSVLARHLDGAYDALLEHIEQRIEDYKTLPDTKSKNGAIIEMRQMVSGARGLHSGLGWLDAASDPPLDLGTRYLVDRITARLVIGQAEVTVVAATDRSYATVTNPRMPVFWLSGAKPLDDDLAIVVFVPRREQRSGLLHPLVIHELGHAANGQHNLTVQVLEKASKDRRLESMAEAAKNHATASDGSEASADNVSAAVDAIRARLAAWIEEAVCDAFATLLLGPTYLYSFMAIVGTSDLDTAGDEHPPTRLRIRLLLEQLDDLGWKDVLAEASPEIDGWFRQTASEGRHYGEADVDFCVDALVRMADEIRKTVALHVGALTFRASDFLPLQQEITALLDAGIPPSQTLDRKSIGRADIILGSWLFAVKKQGGDLDALATAPDVPELARLLPKALQDVALLEAWEPR
jgi:hypothetical protein